MNDPQKRLEKLQLLSYVTAARAFTKSKIPDVQVQQSNATRGCNRRSGKCIHVNDSPGVRNAAEQVPHRHNEPVDGLLQVRSRGVVFASILALPVFPSFLPVPGLKFINNTVM